VETAINAEGSPHNHFPPIATTEIYKGGMAMNESDLENKALPEIMRLERRTHIRAELDSANVMKILRQRAAKAARGREVDP
jgi:hypothetical protein